MPATRAIGTWTWTMVVLLKLEGDPWTVGYAHGPQDEPEAVPLSGGL